MKKEAPLSGAADAEYGSSVSSLSAAGLVGTAVSTFASAAANDPAVISKSARDTFGLKGQSPPLLLRLPSNEEDSKIAAYTDIKHSLPALKLLKRSVSAERKKVAKINLLLDASKPTGKKGKSLFSAALRQRLSAQTGK